MDDAMESAGAGQVPSPHPGPPLHGGNKDAGAEERAGGAGDLHAEVARLRERVSATERDAALRRAISGIDWFDAEDAYRELAARAELGEDGRWCVRSDDVGREDTQSGNAARRRQAGLATSSPERMPAPPDSDADSAAALPISLEDAARELARRKPHWVRARVSGGTGAGGAGGGAGSGGGVPGVAGSGGAGSSVSAGTITYADLLRPENREILQEFIHERKEELERMRAAHFHLRL